MADSLFVTGEDTDFLPSAVNNSALSLHNVASAVNGVEITGTATGTGPSIAAVGSDTDISLNLVTKGSGTILQNGSPFSGAGVSSLNALTSALSLISSDSSVTITPSGSTINLQGSGVSSLNELTSALSLISSDSSVTITPSGSTINLQASGGGGGGGIASAVTPLATQVGGDITVNNFGSDLAELAAASGGPGTGGLDLAVAASVGDVLLVTMSTRVLNNDTGVSVDVATMVSGSPVSWLGQSAGLTANSGITCDAAPPADYGKGPLGFTVPYEVVSGDISGGMVTLRPYYADGGPSTLLSRSVGSAPLILAVVNLGTAPASAPAGGNEQSASLLVNATSVGDAGNRATQFLGSSLPSGWTQQGTAPVSAGVANSSLWVNMGTVDATWYVEDYTPSGALRVETRIRLSVPPASNATTALAVRDSNTGGDAGSGVLVDYEPSNSGGATAAQISLYGMSGGSFTQQGSATAVGPLGLTDYIYIALERNGSNEWNAFWSLDRANWIAVGTANYSQVFTVAQVGLRMGHNGGSASVDLLDVTL